MPIVDIVTRNTRKLYSKPVRNKQEIASQVGANNYTDWQICYKGTDYGYSSIQFDVRLGMAGTSLSRFTAKFTCGWRSTKPRTSFHISLASFFQVPRTRRKLLRTTLLLPVDQVWWCHLHRIWWEDLEEKYELVARLKGGRFVGQMGQTNAHVAGYHVGIPSRWLSRQI